MLLRRVLARQGRSQEGSSVVGAGFAHRMSALLVSAMFTADASLPAQKFSARRARKKRSGVPLQFVGRDDCGEARNDVSCIGVLWNALPQVA